MVPLYYFLFIKANYKDHWSTKAEQKIKNKIYKLYSVFTILLINSSLKN
jgi:hypothetical protein